MSYLNKMYSKSPQQTKNQKNPARVSGGLRAQGVDSFEFLDENGSVNQVPSQRYVNSLEEQLKTIRQQNNILEKKTNRLTTQVQNMEVMIKNLTNRN